MNTDAHYTDFFTVANVDMCPITSCTKYESDCTTAMPDTYAALDSVYPYSIFTRRDYNPGYFVILCYKCETAVSSATKLVDITLTACTSTLSKKPLADIQALTANDDLVVIYSFNSAVTTHSIISSFVDFYDYIYVG